ncbi:MAG: cell division protein FtsQ [Epulopiscium sp.]|jgi:cell division septal protein FtsQ|uniref:FtsQ-type POTRA domain-containing protein n=1 Tax=Defluviitalea raffinosedens TaxID=1450156 RepID=A0A7C8HG68_9FIRM|nr:FtsQ-type POTRA domain-containing protein [Defluviitalea raffinosedens]MBZ4667941.1 divIB [Defluviitaleaceae bacterium]MDK2789038.1 cell division protein FtsQ [Candidatus Epulonipiscium sp.]KAE9637018.1 FtsQ-type POTRA domain-containing protein [Defluviitalea raffinosedens]MBM7685227.1 cell division septal protein FtsQ [Defluviitalea raffinosedens]HHW67334.1 FtsQ-type POTRA domain-containing protein [Candidatus Epulonipiscium sp.]
MGRIIPINNVQNQPKFTKIVLIMVLVVVFFLLFFTSPLFSVQKIEIRGNEHYSEEQILEKINFHLNQNIFLFQQKKAEKLLCKDPYIESASIEVKWPNHVRIQIDERKVVGYVPYVGTYLYIDKDGRVLETSPTYKDHLPIVQGLEFDHFEIGEIIPVKNKSSLNIVAVMAQMMLKYDLLEDIIKIDVSDPTDTHVYVKKLDVSMGNIEEFDKKIQWMIQIMNVYDMGKVDLKNIDKGRAVFSPLT